ncbi:MAG: hypothetical protein AB1405_10185, partial [Bdellovibrionota bacterium]
ITITVPIGEIAKVLEIEEAKCPFVFVNTSWLDEVFSGNQSAYALIDIVNFSSSLSDGSSLREILDRIITAVDEVAKKYPNFMFVSYGDGVLVKALWNARFKDKKPLVRFNPEKLLECCSEIGDAIFEITGLGFYSVLTQGHNAYSHKGLYHHSDEGNHFSLNSLGTPFSFLFDIDRSVRSNIKNGTHGRASVYMSLDFFHALRFWYPKSREYRAALLNSCVEFKSKLAPAEACRYVYANLSELKDYLSYYIKG